MERVVYGKVTSVRGYAGEDCACNFEHPRFYIEEKDYMNDIERSHSISYLTFPIEYDELKEISFGEHDVNSKEYEKLKEFASKAVLSNFYLSYESVYMHTCYSEWTCGDAGEREVVRIGELESLDGKFVIFFLD